MTSQKELEKENTRLKEQIAGLEKRLKELESQKSSTSKSRQQAEQVKTILEKDGLITKEQLAAINPKYVSDPVFYARNLLGVRAILVRGIGYMTEAAHKVWTEQQEAKKAEAEKAKKAAAPVVTPASKEEHRQAAAV